MSKNVAAVCAIATFLAGCSPALDATTVHDPISVPPVATVPDTTTTSAAPTTTSLPLVLVPGEPKRDPTPPDTGESLAEGVAGVAVVAVGGASLAAEQGGEPLLRAREGIPMAVLGREGSSFRVLTPCDREMWVEGEEIGFTPRKQTAAESLEMSVIVLDPGHGGPNRGASGPSGLAEPEVNLDIARRARDLLEDSHDIDWGTGRISTGSAYGPARDVWLTRSEGPPGADYETGLLFRAKLAEAAGADVLVSIHNNAEPDGPYEGPGSEAYYSIEDPDSRRLAGLVVEEFRRGFAGFEVDWVGDTDAGAKYRLNNAGRDYYGVIRLSTVPVVITEGAFISSPEEEDLLRTPAFRQAYAEALYRAIIRFITTDDPGSGFTEPYPRSIPAGSGAPLPTCRLPEQP